MFRLVKQTINLPLGMVYTSFTTHLNYGDIGDSLDSGFQR